LQREAKILELLCASKGETLCTRPLLLELWGDDDFFNSRSLQIFISKLRRRLEPDPRIRIVNVRGEGYKLLVNE
jgi:DNA-binding response OmpR family regulator